MARPLAEAIGQEILDAIEGHLLSADLWRDYHDRMSVVLVGCRAAGLADAFSDVDLDVLIQRPDEEALYRRCWDAVDREVIRILNPRARLHHEFPVFYIPGVDGHYQLTERGTRTRSSTRPSPAPGKPCRDLSRPRDRGGLW